MHPLEKVRIMQVIVHQTCWIRQLQVKYNTPVPRSSYRFAQVIHHSPRRTYTGWWYRGPNDNPFLGVILLGPILVLVAIRSLAYR